MELVVSGPVVEWRGPSPYHYLTVPPAESEQLREVSAVVTYGWGTIPVGVRLGRTEWRTALWPKDGLYMVPIKDSVREREGISMGDTVTAELSVLGLR